MPNIKPISDLRNYTEVLQDVAAGTAAVGTPLWTFRITKKRRPR